MLRELVRRAGKDGDRVRIHQADARMWMQADASAGHDLIATHFFLDCLTDDEVLALARRVFERATPGALWMVSEFALPQGRLAGAMARGVIALLYWAFGWLTGLEVSRLPVYGIPLKASGFDRIERRARLGGLLVAELWRKRTGGTEARIDGVDLRGC